MATGSIEILLALPDKLGRGIHTLEIFADVDEAGQLMELYDSPAIYCVESLLGKSPKVSSMEVAYVW